MGASQICKNILSARNRVSGKSPVLSVRSLKDTRTHANLQT
ncbi:hypothetical protein CKA32_005864 [Geitlerinema sp. FC II]|nr:hypothetical protein CKA32_005864 [Geitlerinema sp. FC II]